jgi:hypothetical protein
MAIKCFLAPNPRYQGRNSIGQPNIGGKLYTYEAGTRTPKATYQDKDGLIPNENPITLDNKGEANVYWQNDNLYYIEEYDSNGVLVTSQDNYPETDNDQDVPADEAIFVHNFVRNPQFTFWSNSSDFTNIKSSINNWDYCVDDWLYAKTSSDSVIEIKKMVFGVGQSDVPSYPINFLRYICSSIGSGGETNSNLYQRIYSVETFNDQLVMPSIALRCVGVPSAIVQIVLVQNFGTGGSPSTPVETIAITANINESWQVFSPEIDITLPSVNGKTLGTDNNDALIFSVKFPSDVTATIDVANAQLIAGNANLSFDYISQNDQFKRLDKTISQGVFSTGDAKATIKNVADAGWLLCDDGTVGSPTSGASHAAMYTKALFMLIWNNISTAYAPIYDSSGALTTRGASAEADYNANKRLALTKTLGRVIASAGQGNLSTTFTAATSTSPVPGLITLASDIANFYYGAPVTLTTTVNLPNGLDVGTTYYVWNNNDVIPNTIYLATTPQNAIDGIGIPLSTTGNGVQTITINYTNWSPGQYIGANKIGIIEGNMPSHNHPGSNVNPGVGAGGTLAYAQATYQGGSGDPNMLNITFDGGSTPLDIMQPTLFLNYMMKL